MNQNDILTDWSQRRNEPLRFLRRGMSVALTAFALSTPALLAAPGGGKGKPGGGGEEPPPPPVDANYTSEYIPVPSWVGKHPFLVCSLLAQQPPALDWKSSHPSLS